MKKTVKTAFLFLMMISISLSGFAKEDLFQSKWIQEKIMMDGSDEDWAPEMKQTYKKFGVEYAFKNNQNYLLALFVFKDPEYLTSVKESGFMVWFNTEGKKKKRYGIRFWTMKLTADQYIELVERQQGELSEDQKSDIRVKKTYSIPDIKVTNKDAKTKLKQKVKVKPAAFDSQEFEDRIVYEFAIPLERAYDRVAGVGTTPGETIKVGFEWGGITEEMKEQRAKLAAAMAAKARDEGATSSLTGERRVSDRMSGSSRSASSFARTMRGSTPPQYNFWVDVKLAEQESTK
ncbi:MAG: hypothetical protein GF421_10205 [Candidatus Aminicenantes bacterium]|nr:hypothetical protein [Candidatus Aminicenantes bacterium]